MTNLEKLIQVIGETFPGIKFVEKEIEETVAGCGFIGCPGDSHDCVKCPNEAFWKNTYVLRDLKPEPDVYDATGYVVMVYDGETRIPYSGCIHPTYKQTENEVEKAEYHGWITSIEQVKFHFSSKGGGKNA